MSEVSHLASNGSVAERLERLAMVKAMIVGSNPTRGKLFFFLQAISSKFFKAEKAHFLFLVALHDG